MKEKAQETIGRQGDFPTDTSGLPLAVPPSLIELADGDTTDSTSGRSSSESATPTFECSPTTARSRDRRSRFPKARP